MTSVTSAEAIHLGMGTSKDTIVVAVLEPGEELPALDRILNREEAVRRSPRHPGHRRRDRRLEGQMREHGGRVAAVRKATR